MAHDRHLCAFFAQTHHRDPEFQVFKAFVEQKCDLLSLRLMAPPLVEDFIVQRNVRSAGVILRRDVPSYPALSPGDARATRLRRLWRREGERRRIFGMDGLRRQLK
jgi:hypothetical protein